MANCTEALRELAQGLNTEVCHDFRKIREEVMCDAWHGVKATGPVTPSSFRDRIEAGWADVRAACATHGGTKPEVGFLEPLSTPTPPETAAPEVETVWEVSKGGEHKGIVVLHTDGTITDCVDDTCESEVGGRPVAEVMVNVLRNAGYEVIQG
jgi:hypothetical protein